MEILVTKQTACLNACRLRAARYVGTLFSTSSKAPYFDVDQDPKRPLILVAHSLGGLLIKQAMVNAKLNSSYGDIASAV